MPVACGVPVGAELNLAEARGGAVVGKKYSDKKKYLKELVRRLYLNL